MNEQETRVAPCNRPSQSRTPGRARLVGKVLGKLPPDSGVPWHRIVNAKGQISLRDDPEAAIEQKILLIDEGIQFNPNNRISLVRFRWTG